MLNAYNTPFRNDEYISKLKLFDEIWEYSEHNLVFLHQMGVKNVHYKPLLPNQIFFDTSIDTSIEKDVDILHFGLWTRHRTDILNGLLEMGYKIYDVLHENGKCVYGDDLHQLVLRSKVILGIHSYPQSAIQESFRYQYPLSNGVPILAEKSLSNPLHLIEFTNIEELSFHLKRMGIKQGSDETYYLQCCFFPFYSSYKEELSRSMETGSFKDEMFYILHQINKDLQLVCQLHKAKIRIDEVRVISIKIFDALMWLLVKVKRTTLLGDKEKKTFFASMQSIYKQLHRPTIRKHLVSTGGFLMPNVRSLLLINGWRLFRWSIAISLKLGKEDKLTYCSLHKTD